jgi:AcrR family transcriptional regulator
MIEACSRRGYAATTASEITTLAGVSKKTLYKHFGSKEECFLATYDVVVRQAVARISAAYRARAGREERDWAAGLCRAFEAFAAEMVGRPAAARLALVDVLAVGPSAADRIARAEAIFTTMVSTSLAQAPDGVVIPPGMIRALIGGVWCVARDRLLTGRADAVAAGGAELGEWLLAYRSPAASLVSAARSGRSIPVASGRPPFSAVSDRARMLEAAASLVARGGYEALTPGQVTDAAGMSASAFAVQFDDRLDCFLAMLDWLNADLLAEMSREGAAAPSWASGVCRAVRTLFIRIASDPSLARVGFPDAFSVSPIVAGRSAAAMRRYAEAFARGVPGERHPSLVIAEAIVGSIWSIARRQVSEGRQRALPDFWPRAAFIAMAPVIGAEEALAEILAAGRNLEVDPQPPTKILSIR